MTIRITYLVTVIVSVLLVIAGNKIATNGLPVFRNASQELVKAKVQKIIGRVTADGVTPNGASGESNLMQSDKIIFEAKITSGPQKGDVVTVAQNFGGYTRDKAKEAAKGDSVLITYTNNEWYFHGYMRINKLLGLGLLFILSVLFFGGKKGFNTILSLGLTCGAIFAVFIPAILSGFNIYVTSILVCLYTIAMTLLIVIGYNKKALTAAIGCASGVAVTGIISAIMDKMLLLTGIVDEHSRYLANLPVEASINLRAIIFAGVIIGAMGAIMDVAMSISSSLWEVKEKAGIIKFESLFRSGLTIGRDIMGTMANTLILAYIGSSLSVVIILSVYSGSALSLFNSEMIVVELLQALAGSLGILAAMPLTALVCSVSYLKAK
jgi:uncharacterized membrane protein